MRQKDHHLKSSHLPSVGCLPALASVECRDTMRAVGNELNHPTCCTAVSLLLYIDTVVTTTSETMMRNAQNDRWLFCCQHNHNSSLHRIAKHVKLIIGLTVRKLLRFWWNSKWRPAATFFIHVFKRFFLLFSLKKSVFNVFFILVINVFNIMTYWNWLEITTVAIKINHFHSVSFWTIIRFKLAPVIQTTQFRYKITTRIFRSLRHCLF